MFRLDNSSLYSAYRFLLSRFQYPTNAKGTSQKLQTKDVCVRKTSQLKPRKSVYMWKRLRLSSLGGNSKWMDWWTFNTSPPENRPGPKRKAVLFQPSFGANCETSGGVWVIDFQLVGPNTWLVFFWEQTSSKAVFWQWCWHQTWKTAWWFQNMFWCSSPFGEMIQFDSYFSDGWLNHQGFFGISPWQMGVSLEMTNSLNLRGHHLGTNFPGWKIRGERNRQFGR